MVNFHNIGIAPFGGGSLSINNTNSYVTIIDATTFIASYGQLYPAYNIIALGKCVDGYISGNPKLIYQIIVDNNASKILLSKLSSTHFAAWFIYPSGESKIVVYEIVDDMFVEKNTHVLGGLIQETEYTYSYSGTNYFIGSVLGFDYCKTNISYYLYRDTSNNIKLCKFAYNPNTDEILTKETIIYTNGSSRLNIEINFIRGDNVTYLVTGITSYSSSGTWYLEMRPRTYTLHSIDIGSYFNDTWNISTISDIPGGNGSGLCVIDGSLYKFSDRFLNVVKIDGFDLDYDNLTTLSTGTVTSFPQFPTNVASYKSLICQQVHPKYCLLVDENGKGNSNLEISVFGLVDDETVGLAPGDFRVFNKADFGNISYFQRSFAVFEDCVVIPVFNNNQVRLMVIKA